MVGHKMAQAFIKNDFDLFLNSRSYSKFLQNYFPSSTVYDFDLLNQNIEQLLLKCAPDYIINAAGITIRRGAANNLDTRNMNSILPKKIDSWCKENYKK